MPDGDIWFLCPRKVVFYTDFYRMLKIPQEVTHRGWIRVLMSVTPNYDQIIYNVAAQNKKK